MKKAHQFRVFLSLLLLSMQLPVPAVATANSPKSSSKGLFTPNVDENPILAPELDHVGFSVRQTYPRSDHPDLPVSKSNVTNTRSGMSPALDASKLTLITDPTQELQMHYGDKISLKFSRPTSQESSSEMVTVKPELSHQTIYAQGDCIFIEGLPAEGQKHGVIHLSKKLKASNAGELGKAVDIPISFLPAKPVILNQQSPFGTMQLPPSTGSFPLYTVNVPRLHISIYEVPVSWMLQPKKETEAILPFNSRPAFETDIDTTGKTNKICKTEIPLQKLLASGARQLFLRVTGSGLSSSTSASSSVSFGTLLQVTDLSITAISGHDGKLYCSVSSFSTGRPVANLRLKSLDRPDLKTTTDENGLAHFNLSTSARLPKFLIAEKDGDVAVLRTQDRGSRGLFCQTAMSNSYAFTDRACYQAGDTVNVKGWFRKRTASPMSDLAFFDEPAKPLAFNVMAQSKQITEGQVTLGHLQSFSFSFVLPKDASPGRASINFIPFNIYPANSCSFLVVNSKSPEFQTLVDGPSSAAIGSPITFNAKVLNPTNAAVMPVPLEWSILVRAARQFTVPGWSSYSFAPFTGAPRIATLPPPVLSECISTTDDQGKGAVEILLNKYQGLEALEVGLSASPKGHPSNRLVQPALKPFSNTIVPCADVCIGVCSDTFQVAKGADAKFKVVVLDQKGNVLADRRVQLKLYKISRADDYAQAKITKLVTGSEWISKPEAATVQFQLPEIGEYILRASTRDEHGHETESCSGVSAVEHRPLIDRQLKLNQNELQLRADKAHYAAGDVATMTLSAPYKSYSGIYTVRTDGIVKIGNIESDTNMCKFSVPITESCARSCNVDAIIHANDPLVEGTAMLSTSVKLPIGLVSRTLKVTVTPHLKQAESGQEANVDFLVTTPDGKPAANADLCALAIDDSQLEQTAFSIPNPINTFYPAYINPITVDDMNLFAALQDLSTLEKAYQMDQTGDPLPFSCIADSGRHYTQDGASFFVPPTNAMVDGIPAYLNVGSNSIPLEQANSTPVPEHNQTKQADQALFQPNLQTDEHGRATAEFALPNGQVGYHIFAVAASQAKYFGIGEAAVNGHAK
jgi:uncharacterized protein YfaS (alpha-2-macroglobulin family)